MSGSEIKSQEQKGAEAQVEGFRKELGPFVVAADETRMPMLFTNAKEAGDPIIFVNDSLLALTGYGREEMLGQSFRFLMAYPDDSEAMALVEAAFRDAAGSDLEICCRRKDGGAFWGAAFFSPVPDKSGDVVQNFVSLVDVTKHKLEEERLRLLLDELNHRTQNTLATVQAIARQTLGGAAHADVLDAFQGRILALSKAHSLLGRDNWLAANLREVIDQILQPFGFGGSDAARFSVHGEDIRLPSKAALTLAMVFHELATNAAKHGALSNGSAGKIDIGWQVAPSPAGDQLRLRWEESGGPPVTAPRRKGFGTRLIEGALAQELDGEVRLDYRPTGVVCQIVMPVPLVADG
jgi:PAS domain S-box-containing protein